MGIPPKLTDGLEHLSQPDKMGELRGRHLQVRPERESGEIVGRQEEQRQHELRKVQQGDEV